MWLKAPGQTQITMCFSEMLERKPLGKTNLLFRSPEALIPVRILRIFSVTNQLNHLLGYRLGGIIGMSNAH